MILNMKIILDKHDCRIVSIEIVRKEMVGKFHKIRAGAGGCTFLHKDGFLASFETLDQAVEAANGYFEVMIETLLYLTFCHLALSRLLCDNTIVKP